MKGRGHKCTVKVCQRCRYWLDSDDGVDGEILGISTGTGMGMGTGRSQQRRR